MAKGKEKDGIERIKKLEEEIAKKKALLVRERGKLSEKERKARTRQLIQIGGLAEIAGLSDSDAGFLLGYLLNASDIAPQSERWKTFKAKGDALLKDREDARKKSQKKEG